MYIISKWFVCNVRMEGVDISCINCSLFPVTPSSFLVVRVQVLEGVLLATTVPLLNLPSMVGMVTLVPLLCSPDLVSSHRGKLSLWQ